MPARSPLAALDLALRVEPGQAGIHLGERLAVDKVELRGDASDAGFLRLVQETIGMSLPPPGRATASAGRIVYGTGPDEWLLTGPKGDGLAGDRLAGGGPAGDGPALAARLATALAGRHALALDVGAAWTVLHIGGPEVIELLAGLVAIDLEPPAFTAGCCTATRLGALRVILAQTANDPPGFDLYVPRSLARGVWEHITATAAPFGVAIVPIPA